MKSRHLILIGAAMIAAPFIYHFATIAIVAKVTTVLIIIAAVVVCFEACFTALRDFGGFHD